jgi:hypothetical protein
MRNRGWNYWAWICAFSFTVAALGRCALAATVTVQMGQYPSVITVADVDNDGHKDIIAAADDSSGGLTWMLNVLRGYGNTTGYVGQFHAVQTKDLALDDDVYTLNAIGVGNAAGDSYPDVFFLAQDDQFSKVYRIFGNGDGTFGAKTAWNTGDNPNPMALTVFDRNAGTDSYPDIAYIGNGTSGGNYTDTLGVRCGSDTGGFSTNENTAMAGNPLYLKVVDVTSDSVKDYVMLDYDGDATVIAGASNCNAITGTKFTSSLAIAGTPMDFAVADVTGDGKPDILVLTADKIWIASGNNNGTFNTATSTSIESDARVLAVADVDNDGDVDAVIGSLLGGDEVGTNVTIHTNNGSGTLSNSTVYMVADSPSNIVVADMDENGTPDLVIGSVGTGVVSVIER